MGKPSKQERRRQLAVGIWELKDGRVWVQASLQINGKRRERTATMPPGTTLAQAAIRQEELVQEAEMAIMGCSRPALSIQSTLSSYETVWFKSRYGPSSTVSACTRKNVSTAMRLHILPYLGHFEIGQISKATLRSWINTMLQRRKPNGELYSKGAIQNWWNHLTCLIKDACDDLEIRDPSVRITFPKIKASDRPIYPKRALSAEELGKLLDAVRPRYRTMILFIARTGVRRSTAIKLTWQDVDLSKGTVQATGKGKTITIALTADLWTALKRQRKQVEEGVQWVFPSPRDASKPVSHDLPRIIVKRAAEKAGIGEVTTHDLRRTVNTLLLNSGASPERIRGVLGHSNRHETERYDKSNPEQQRALLEVLGSPEALTGEQ